MLNTSGTKSQQELMKIVKENFDLRPGRIIKDLKLKNPIFQQSFTYCHLGCKSSNTATKKVIKMIMKTFVPFWSWVLGCSQVKIYFRCVRL